MNQLKLPLFTHASVASKFGGKAPSKNRYTSTNIEAAQVILADPDKYDPISGLSQWARTVLEHSGVRNAN